MDWRDDPTIVITPKARASFAKVFKAESYKQKDGTMSEPKYSLTLLIPKDTDIRPLRVAMKKAIEDKWGSKPPKKLVKALDDGDALESDGERKFPYDGYENMWVLKTTTSFKPTVKARNGTTEIGESDFYSGCWCRAGVKAKAWSYENMKRGVSFYLLHAQFLEDGDPFGSKVDAEDMFNDEVSEKDEAGQMFGDEDGMGF